MREWEEVTKKGREKMNRGKFVHKFTQIYTNWRLVRPVSPFKTGACLLMGRNFRIVADNITAYFYWKWNYGLWVMGYGLR